MNERTAHYDDDELLFKIAIQSSLSQISRHSHTQKTAYISDVLEKVELDLMSEFELNLMSKINHC